MASCFLRAYACAGVSDSSGTRVAPVAAEDGRLDVVEVVVAVVVAVLGLAK